jgi:mRNA interferase RelE/StbE
MTSKTPVRRWVVELDARALKELRKIGSSDRGRILKYLRDTVATREDPTSLGKALTGGELAGLWRYRVGDYRILARLEHDRLVVYVVEIGNRREIYR